MKYVPNWSKENKTCYICGTNKSTKWEHLGIRFCNRCIALVFNTTTIKEIDVIKEKWNFRNRNKR